jgi:hypothetical protein
MKDISSSQKGLQGDNKFWWGQVAPNQIENEIAENGFGFRVRVRIQGIHPLNAEVRNEDLPLAIVEMPTTHGNGNRLTSGLVGGEFVRGYFLDDKKQVPVISSVLARTTSEKDIQASRAMSQGTTFGRPVAPNSQTRFNSKPHQTISGSSPNGPAIPKQSDLSKEPSLMNQESNNLVKTTINDKGQYVTSVREATGGGDVVTVNYVSSRPPTAEEKAIYQRKQNESLRYSQ